MTVVAMSVFTFRGVDYERDSMLPGAEAPFQQLIYSSLAQKERVIRSAQTAELLQLEDPQECSHLVYRGVPVRPLLAKRLDRGPIQQGGFIRSRMTAELLGINPVKAASAPVRLRGVVRSRPTAYLLNLY